jgi:Fe-S protein assembly co-chaperone HscB
VQEKQQLAADQSSLLNRAFETLKDPLKRAEYLLALRGHSINEEDTLHAQQDLLMDVMEVRQKLEEAEGDERINLVLQNEGLFLFLLALPPFSLSLSHREYGH